MVRVVLNRYVYRNGVLIGGGIVLIPSNIIEGGYGG
jgi:hypothetical protein